VVSQVSVCAAGGRWVDRVGVRVVGGVKVKVVDVETEVVGVVVRHRPSWTIMMMMIAVMN